jgi:zinc and cadmium transporter
LERFFCFHHHDVPEGKTAIETSVMTAGCGHEDHRHDTQHRHRLSWSGAALGLTLHSIINGIALAAAVKHDGTAARLAGFGTFLVIVLHKPFDAMTIATLMARGGWSLGWRQIVNAAFALAIPLGVAIFFLGIGASSSADDHRSVPEIVAYSLAFSAGTFLCISLSDLLPELQFHQHDRLKLSIALLLGLSVAYVAGRIEAGTHRHHNPPAAGPTHLSQAALPLSAPFERFKSP